MTASALSAPASLATRSPISRQLRRRSPSTVAVARGLVCSTRRSPWVTFMVFLPVVVLRRFPMILDHSVIQYHRETPWVLVLAHVLVGEPDPTSPGHALAGADRTSDR